MERIFTVSELALQSIAPEYLFWVGCAGSFDQRAQKVTRAFATILQKLDVSFAILGAEETCTGDPARRAGNEFSFQMAAYQNIELLNSYNIKKIITTCPHCFNIFKNEYPVLGGNFEVIHHSQFLEELIQSGKIKIKQDRPKLNKITYQDSCYLGRGNNIYEAPRTVIEALSNELVEMKRCKKNGFCCGAGGAQMFKEEEAGRIAINKFRTEEAMATNAEIIAVACPYCNTMMSDGLKTENDTNKTQVLDIAELVAAYIA